MKYIYRSIVFLSLLLITCNLNAGVKIVVLGSSTAQGAGPLDGNNAWVNRYRTYLQSLDGTNQVINLAKGGYTTCQIMPADYTPPAANSNLVPDTSRNITKAISLKPNAIIINMPTNDVSNGISGQEQLSNYAKMVTKATEANIPVWICTTQPHCFSFKPEFGPARTLLRQLKDSIIKIYEDRSIDFYTLIANPVDGTINTIFDSGDGVHLNDSAHAILFQRVVQKDIPSKAPSTDDRVVSTLSNPVNINFGSVATDPKWNSVANCYVNNPGNSVENLIDINGEQTGIMIQVSTGFSGVNTTGMAGTNTALNMPDDVSKSNFYGSSQTGSELIISGLDKTQGYTFKVFASRASQTDVRNTQVTFIGHETKSNYADAVINTTQLIEVENVIPADNGNITMRVEFGPNTSNYYYLNAMRIESYANQTGLKSTSDTKLAYAYKKGNMLVVHLTELNFSDTTVELFDISGRSIAMQKVQSQGSSIAMFPLNKKGAYVIKITKGDKKQQIKYIG